MPHDQQAVDESVVKVLSMQDLVSYMAEKNNVTKLCARNAYAMVIDGIKDLVSSGSRVQLYGFGSFYLQRHKGHRTQFSSGDSRIPDYLVLKFSAAASLNKHLRDLPPSVPVVPVRARAK